MAALKDYYKILGVAEDATVDSIKKAYRKLARKYHPDLTGNDPAAEAKFKEVSEAYAVLGDKTKRAEYDQARKMPDGGGFSFNFDDLREGAGESMFGEFGLGDILSSLFGGGRSRRNGGGRGGGPSYGSMGGRDLEGGVDLTLMEAVRGGKKSVWINREAVNVNIPPGVEDGTKLRLRGKGEPGYGGGPPGDAYLVVRVLPHPFMTRSGDDLHMDLPVTIGEAVLGAKVSVPTVDGSVLLTVPAGSRSGQLLRVRGKGVKNRRTGVPGDQYYRLVIDLPRQLDEKAVQLVKELEEITEYEAERPATL